MSNLVQVIVVLIAIYIMIFTIGHRSTHFGRAWKKVALLFLSVIMIISVIFPNAVDDLAHFMGIGRGADLLLYTNVMAFVLYVINNYMYQQDQRDRMYRLARKVAIIEANEKYEKELNK